MFKPFVHRNFSGGVCAALTAFFFAFTVALHAQRAAVATHSVNSLAALTASDAGAVPTSQPVQLTLRIAMTAERSAALDQLLTAQNQPSTASYHQWLTPAQFAASYGATDDQIESLQNWVQSQGLTVSAISPAKTRMTITGTAGQVQQAFAVTLHHYVINGADYYANATQPSAPAAVAAMVAGISGLNNLPLPAVMTVQPVTTAQATRAVAAIRAIPALKNPTSAAAADPFADVASTIDANTASLLAITSSACSADFSQADYDAYTDLFRQANAQGITVLATSGCGTRGTGSFPASLQQVTSVAVDPTQETFAAIEPRADWQLAAGLPADGNRDEPDLTTSSLADFTQAITTILQNTGSRQGNINPRLYKLASTPDLYTQPNDAPLGTWEASTGLGTVNLADLIKAFPNATTMNATTTALVSNSYAINYGQTFTLTATVLPVTYGASNPTGSVTFSAASQGVLGSGTVNSNGVATFTPTTALAVGAYTLTANYNGDGNYTSSGSTSSVVITVSAANATVVASVSPTTVPYGNTATVTTTVTLPGTLASPSGTVTASIDGITSAVYTGTLSPNPGGNSATANTVVAVPPPSTTAYTVETTCAGSTNYTCQTPVLLKLTSTKGNSQVTVSVNPDAPQAGSPITLTAVVSNTGNGTGPYTFTGSVTFYDNGTLLKTVGVSTNQTTAVVTLSGGVSHSIVATYTGDNNWNTSTSSPVIVNPTLLPATMTLGSNASTALAGVNMVFTATVFTTASSTVGPTGTVKFYDTFNGSLVLLGTSTLTPNGPNESIAVFNTTGLLAGSHSVYAIYGGDTDFTPVTSSTIPVTLSDFTVIMVPQTLTLSAGQKGQVVALVGLVGGFNGTVTFGCTPPAGTETTCSFSPVTMLGGGTTTMTITTTAATYSASAKTGGQQARHGGSWRLAAGSTSALATLLCLMLPSRRRTIPMLFLALLTLSLPAGLGCGLGILTNANSGSGSGSGSGTGTITDPGTPLGTSNFTITTAGTDGVNTVRHTYQYQVTVQ